MRRVVKVSRPSEETTGRGQVDRAETRFARRGHPPLAGKGGDKSLGLGCRYHLTDDVVPKIVWLLQGSE